MSSLYFESLNEKIFKRDDLNTSFEQTISESNWLNPTFDWDLSNLSEYIESFPFCNESTTSLLVVDVQNDFVSGTMRIDACPSKENPKSIIPVINALARLPFKRIFATGDFHPLDHISFYENRCMWQQKDENVNLEKSGIRDAVNLVDRRGVLHSQVLWPAHCVRGTWGCSLDADLQLPKGCVLVEKGTISDVECYSAFGDPERIEDTHLHEQLKESSINLVVICGIAYDYCVADTALDAARLGYRVAFVEDACVCVDQTSKAKQRQKMLEAGVFFTTSSEIPALIAGELIPLQHILQHLRRQKSNKE